MREYYRILGLKEGASLDEIKEAYKKLSKKFHPDVNNGDKFFEQRFKELTEAYEKLINHTKQKIKTETASTKVIVDESKNLRLSEKSKSSKSNIFWIIPIGIITCVLFYYYLTKDNHKRKDYYIPSVEMFQDEFPRYYSFDSKFRKYYPVNIDGDQTDELVLPLVYTGENWLEGKNIKLMILDFQNDWEITEIFNSNSEIIVDIQTYPKSKPTEIHLTTNTSGINYVLLNYEIVTEVDNKVINKFSDKFSQNKSFKVINDKCYGISSIRENGIDQFGCLLFKVSEYKEENNKYHLSSEKVTEKRYGGNPKDSNGCELYTIERVLTDIIFEHGSQ